MFTHERERKAAASHGGAGTRGEKRTGTIRALPLSYRPVEVGAGWTRTSDHAITNRSNPMLTASWLKMEDRGEKLVGVFNAYWKRSNSHLTAPVINE